MLYNTRKTHFKYVNGCYEHTATPFTSVNGEDVLCVCDLSRHESSKCWVLHTKSAIYLQSYSTIASKYYEEDGEGYIVESKHSPTTSRQQSWFAHECDCKNRKVVESVL